MTVSELIEFLKTQPQDLPVAYAIYSEYALLESEDIVVRGLCLPREDGWVASKRPDRPSQQYLVFPGN
jgi:hypothetical protein